MKSLLLASLLLLVAPLARGELWLCTDAEGYKEFSYDPESAGRKNCVRHVLTPQHNVVRKVRPGELEGQQKSPAFPRVDAGTQKKRDAERRGILERELAAERASLDAASQQLAAQKSIRVNDPKRGQERLKLYEDRVRLHQTNVESLRREIGDDEPVTRKEVTRKAVTKEK